LPKCRNCGSGISLHGERCEPCAKFKLRNGYERPEVLVMRAAERHENKDRAASIGSAFGFTPDMAMTREQWGGGQEIDIDPPCECGRPVVTGEARCEYCRALAWSRGKIAAVT
jgi:hypothetical protein